MELTRCKVVQVKKDNWKIFLEINGWICTIARQDKNQIGILRQQHDQWRKSRLVGLGCWALW